MKSATMKNFHLPLPQNVYADLQEEAKKRGRPTTVVARGAIEAWLRQVRRREVAEGIAAYAEKYGGTLADLDPAWEEAGLEAWRNSER